MTTPKDPHTKVYSHVNGTAEELLDRIAVSELCKGWPVYRDASEWKNFRSLFTDDATVWTTWSGPCHIDDFIAISKAGKAKGDFIMHRECGTLVELNSSKKRAIGKMKATITQRFTVPDIDPFYASHGWIFARGTHPGGQHVASKPDTPTTESHDTPMSAAYDVDCDCRFIFFCDKTDEGWKARFVKLFYDKDKIVQVNHLKPRFDAEELQDYPEGYKYLGAAQARRGYVIDRVLPTSRNALWWRMYGSMEKWLDGEDPALKWEDDDKAKEDALN